MSQKLEKIEKVVEKSTLWNDIKSILNLHFDFSEDISISVKDLLIVITVVFITSLILRFVLKLITKNLPLEDKGKFNVIYGYFRWLVYLLIY